MRRSVYLKNHEVKGPNTVKEDAPRMGTPHYLFTLDLRIIDLQRGSGVCQRLYAHQSVPE